MSNFIDILEITLQYLVLWSDLKPRFKLNFNYLWYLYATTPALIWLTKRQISIVISAHPEKAR